MTRMSCWFTTPAKVRAKNKPQGKFDIKGNGGITDMADTVLVLWRNKPKEAALRQAEARRQTPDRETLEKFDAVLQCHKQRNGEEEPAPQPGKSPVHRTARRCAKDLCSATRCPHPQDRKAAAAADSEVML